MIASVLILAFSLALLLYWFRYTCMLVLTAERPPEYAMRVAAVNQLNFLLMEQDLTTASQTVRLNQLEQALERDYRVLRYLLDNAAGFRMRSLEQRMLLMDFTLMQTWYRLSRNFSAAQSRKALQEMWGIMRYIADEMGQRPAYQIPA